MSTAWHTEYLSALAARDKLEHTSKEVYSAYARLAEQRQHLVHPTTPTTTSKQGPLSPSPSPHSPTPQPSAVARVSSWSRGSTPSSAVTAAPSGRWQEELSEAQRRRAELEAALSSATAELDTVRVRLKTEEKRVGELSAENAVLLVKVRDRVEELKAKAKLVQDVHDEAVALNLQLNISEESNARLKKENKELVDRWMARMGKEADALNDASKFS